VVSLNLAHPVYAVARNKRSARWRGRGEVHVHMIATRGRLFSNLRYRSCDFSRLISSACQVNTRNTATTEQLVELLNFSWQH